MAISADNLFTNGFRGTVGGNMTFRRLRSGRIVVCKRRGPSSKPLTGAQKNIHQRFKTGIIYAKAAIADPALKAAYAAAAGPDQSAFNMAMRDACKPPQVRTIITGAYSGRANQPVTIRAIDDFQVTGVKVTLHHAAGTLLEEGSAVLQPNGLDWVYTTTRTNKQLTGTVITAVAKDTPGNEGSLQITL